MATDQATYGLVAYDRLVNQQPALYDYSDVVAYVEPEIPTEPETPTEPEEPETPEEPEIPETAGITATLGLPAQINGGDSFNGTISVNTWDNEGGYKLVDFIVNVPAGVSVTNVAAV